MVGSHVRAWPCGPRGRLRPFPTGCRAALVDPIRLPELIKDHVDATVECISFAGALTRNEVTGKRALTGHLPRRPSDGRGIAARRRAGRLDRYCAATWALAAGKRSWSTRRAPRRGLNWIPRR